MSFGLGGLFPLALLLPLQQSYSVSETSGWTSMMQSFGYLIGGILPIIMGTIIDKTGAIFSNFWVMGMMAVSLIILSLFFSKNK